ncbi:hypothetical protein F5Y03DRAFT_397024 [Xylaria venustula]|nr:hypothetical protein F5Y03DRAFT_397024 [Xylaria venustula]
MTTLKRLFLLSLTGTTLSQSPEFITFLAPQEGDAVVQDSTYIIKWTTELSTGSCTIALLIGQTPDALGTLWNIAYGINVGSGNFAWPVGFPTTGAALGNFYGINISLDSNEGMFDVSPSFKVVSKSASVGQSSLTQTHNTTGLTASVISSTSAKSRPISSTSSEHGSDISQTKGVTSFSTFIPSVTQPVSGPETSSTDSPPNQQTNDNDQKSVTSKGFIAGIVVAAVLSLVSSLSLIGVLLYYRHGVFEKVKRSLSVIGRESVIDGRFGKAELDGQGTEVNVVGLYELDATREMVEVDGKMKPVELDSNNR